MFSVLIGIAIAASPPEALVSSADRGGPTRPAVCTIDGQPPRPCRFTPLFGDGSFQIEIGDDLAYRLVVDGGQAAVFDVLSADRRVPILATFLHDARRPACWVSPDAGTRPRSICAERAPVRRR